MNNSNKVIKVTKISQASYNELVALGYIVVFSNKLDYLVQVLAEVKSDAMNNPNAGSSVALLAAYQAVAAELAKVS